MDLHVIDKQVNGAAAFTGMETGPGVLWNIEEDDLGLSAVCGITPKKADGLFELSKIWPAPSLLGIIYRLHRRNQQVSVTELKRSRRTTRHSSHTAGANQLGQPVPVFIPEVASRETFPAGEAQANSVDGASHGLSARPASANVLIAAVSPVAFQAGGANAAPSGP
ncbi:hypothetical protein R6X40_30280 [Rhizobium sp. PL01]|nr:hypothetical protein [Rhizobium sp. PL01]MDW5318345.1 hypothetical protein [Rhizobium sp. PL01]